MSKLDDLKNKAKDLVTENRDRIEEGLEKAGDMINERTGGKHEDKIEKGLNKAKEGLDRVEGTQSGDDPMSEATPSATAPDPGHSAAPPSTLLEDATVTGSSGPPGTNGASVDATAKSTQPGN